jgi:response regulator NasT
MESALIVSSTDKSTALITELLNEAVIKHIAVLDTAGEARRMLVERDFDVVIINAPLPDESGENLARHIAVKTVSQVILVVKSEFFEEVSAVCENDGVLTISKPMEKAVFWSALMLARSAQNRIKRILAENAKLKQKIEDIRVVDRAKYILITRLNLTEQEAHRFIEKQAMDMRTTKRSIAEGILKTYGN